MAPNDVTHHHKTAIDEDEESSLLISTMAPVNNKHSPDGDLELQLNSKHTGTHHRHHHHHHVQHEHGSDDEFDGTVITENSSSSSNGSHSSVNSTHNKSNHNKHNLLLGSAANVKAFMSCMLYSFCSVSMVLVNKSLTSSYSSLYVGDLNILLVVFQAIVAVISVSFCKAVGLVEYPPVTVSVLKAWSGVNVMFCLMLFTGMASLQYNSVPMVTVFKNVSNIVTASGDYFLFGNQSGRLEVAAFVVMLLGAVAAASNDINASATGLFWMMANCLTTSGYVLYMKFATKTVKTTKFGMVFLNNVLAICFLLPVAFMFGEVSIFTQSKGLHTMDYFTKNMFAGFVGFALNFASLNCVQVTGPTTYAIVGSLNKVPVAFLGYMLFDNMITADTWFFISIAMCGGFLYSFAKIRSNNK